MKRSNDGAMFLLPLLLAASWGCGPELVGGGGHGDVHTTVSDESGSGAPSAHRAGGPSPSLSGSDGFSARQALVEGSTTVEIAAELLTSGGGSIELTDGRVTRTVTIGADAEVEVTEREVEEGVYSGVRLTFSRVEATLAPGGPLPLEIAVSLGSAPLVVEVPLEVTVREEETTRVNVALNSALWIALADPVTGVVEPGEFAAAISVTVGEGE